MLSKEKVGGLGIAQKESDEWRVKKEHVLQKFWFNATEINGVWAYLNGIGLFIYLSKVFT